ncbi:MAG: thiamine pyrophosphate-binding protein [Alphaproteobacteria bacterium]|nr:thiamine pyrophosphate-binding protein [Alphaproteobacteria bacterium]
MSNQNNKLTGGQAINRALQRYGVNSCFALAGTAHAHLLHAMAQDSARHPWTIFSGRHESGTVGAADGYARASGKLGVAMIGVEHGIANAVTGICVANAACSPVLVLATTETPSQIEAVSDRSNDLLDMVKPYVKWARTVPSVDRLEEYIHAGAKQALSGRPGVAVVGIPNGWQARVVDAAERVEAPLTLPGNPAPAPEAIAAAADLLANAKRPMVVLGAGAMLSGAGAALRKLASTYRWPVLANGMGRGLVPEDMTLGFNWPLAQVAAKDADVVLVIGCRLTQRIGFGLPPRFAKNAKFIQVDVDAGELRRNRDIDVAVVADARRMVEALLTELDRVGAKPLADPSWVNDAMGPRLTRIAEVGHSDAAPIHPFRIGRELMKVMPEDGIYVGDGADMQNWMYAVHRIRRERCFMDHYPFGYMGSGTPLAMGAATAMKEEAAKTGKPVRPTVLVTGDGAFGFHCAEWNGAVMAGLRLIGIISNDGGWGTEKHGHIKAFGGQHFNCELGHCDYQLIGEAFGAIGRRIEQPGDIAPALKMAFAADRPVILNVITDPMAGLARKNDPRLQTIAFEDLVSSLKIHYTPEVA